jgi:hypothetical protein
VLSRRAVAVAGVASLALLAGCDSGTGDTSRALAERVTVAVGGGAEEVASRLAELGVDVDTGELRSLEPGDLRCPEVRDPAPGDRATCHVALAGEEVSIDVEFGADAEAVTVVRIEVAP